jgi:hypothetical protein
MSLRYLDEFMRLRCAPDLLAAKLFPNAKEVSESMGAWNAVREHVLPRVPVLRDDPAVSVFCVGDGHVPRTTALFAHLTRWNCYGIDPVMRPGPYRMDRVLPVRLPIEEFSSDSNFRDPLVLIVHVHSHASLKMSVANIRGGGYRYLINIPCCRKPDLGVAPMIAYDDPAILSAKRRVEIYDLNELQPGW